MNVDLLKLDLIRDEGKRNKPYRDTVGKCTIGVGRNLDDVGISDGEIDVLLTNDIARAVSDLDKNANWWRAMSDARQRVLANMCFNLGWPRLSQFTNTLDCMHKSDYQGAANGMRNSLWYKQVGARAERLAKIMENDNGV